MKILTKWLRAYLPGLTVDDAQLAEDLTLRGIAVEGIYPLGEGNGSLYEMDITTNRVDAMNHYGIAREAAAIYGLKLPALDFALPAAQPAKTPFPVKIEAEDACGRFTARVLRDVTIGESRDWFAGAEVATYFALLEQKMISNAVDATNFAWLAMGQPTHAFDLDKIEGGIIVRRARKGERLKTLDGVDAYSRTRRSGGGRSQEGAGAGRRDGRLGHDDYAGDEERARRGGVVRSHGGAANGAAAWTAHRCQPPLRARRGLQCGAGGVGAGERDSAGQRRMD